MKKKIDNVSLQKHLQLFWDKNQGPIDPEAGS